MELLGPVYAISMPPHQMLVMPTDLEDLRVAVRHAIQATDLDPRKVGNTTLQHGPFDLTFHAVTRGDVKPHWAGALHYQEQELPLFRWDDEGSLVDLYKALFTPSWIRGILPVPPG